MTVSRIAIGAALAFGSASLLAVPALAQSSGNQQEAAAPKLNLSKAERAALQPLITAVNAKNWAAASAAMPAAQAAAQGADARYIVAQSQLNLAIGTNDKTAQVAAIDAMIASGRAPAASLPALYRNQAALAQQANDVRKAEAALMRWTEVAPNDPEALVALAENKVANRKTPEAVALFDRAIAARQASGQPIPESWYKRSLRFAYEGKMMPQSVKFTQALVTAYPTKENWRDALLIYRDLSGADKTMNLDIMRLMRASKSLSGERDYYELANQLYEGGYPGETKAVLDEGVAYRMVDRNKPGFKDLLAASGGKVAADRQSLPGLEAKARAAATGTLAMNLGEAYFGYNNYAKAAEFYRLAGQKGGVDAGVANTRLGMALALAGQKAEAETALRAVTGPRAGLAGYWLIWLNQRA